MLVFNKIYIRLKQTIQMKHCVHGYVITLLKMGVILFCFGFIFVLIVKHLKHHAPVIFPRVVGHGKQKNMAEKHLTHVFVLGFLI